ncbi:Cytochrome P450 77A4 [Platanthera zijinensis]|uniref:Cytochrome P450 77A4 n=1 Tax=Platanthera zijinensis TaxID=2320716 RepID=A0AAP0GG41_9ASPA
MAVLRHLFAAVALPVTLLLLLFLFRRHHQKKPHLPPGPPGWPIVGNLFQVAFSGKQFTQYVSDLIPIHGDLFTVRMGVRTLIFIAGANLAREALVEKSLLFVNRPAENPTRSVFSCNKLTVNSALYGPEWRSLRRNMVSGMLSTSRLREFSDVRRAAMDRFIDRIRAEAASAGGAGAVWVLQNARFAVFCILLKMCFGLELDEETVVLVDALMKKVLNTISPRLDEFLPLLRPFFSGKRAEAMEVRREQIETVVSLIEKRREILKSPRDYPGAAAFSYLDSLLDFQIEGRNTAITDVELVTLCSELLNGGTDTTATAVEWGVAQLIDKPHLQQRLFEEINAVVGDDDPRPVTEKETEKMVFLQAFVKELLRKHPPTYFSLTHAAVKPEKLGGYDIPPDANLEIYFPAISEDPRLWSKPEEFDPERFLTGGESADITGVKEIKMIPFGAGRRVCPGLAMGTTHITLMLARMVQAFEWRPSPEAAKVNFGSKLEFTVVMSPPLRATVVPRK